MKTKQDVLHSIYGENIPFTFDCSLPITFLDKICETVSKHWGMETQEVYKIAVNSVYAYGKGKQTNTSGFVPLTFEAQRVFMAYNQLTGIFPFFIPTIKQ